MRTILFLLFFWAFSGTLFAQTKAPDTISYAIEGDYLQGYFYYAGIPNAPTVFHLPGFMDSGDKWNLGTRLADAGINFFTIDFRGCYQSEGKHSLDNAMADVRYGLKWLKDDTVIKQYKLDTTNLILSGYSYGGGIALAYAIQNPEVKNIIGIAALDIGTFAGQLETDNYLASFYSVVYEMAKKPTGPIDFLYADPVEDVYRHQQNFSVLKNASMLGGRNVLLLVGKSDDIVNPLIYTLPLHRQLKMLGINSHLKSFPTGHSFGGQEEQITATVINWLRQIE